MFRISWKKYPSTEFLKSYQLISTGRSAQMAVSSASAVWLVTLKELYWRMIFFNWFWTSYCHLTLEKWKTPWEFLFRLAKPTEICAKWAPKEWRIFEKKLQDNLPHYRKKIWQKWSHPGQPMNWLGWPVAIWSEAEYGINAKFDS